MPAFARRDVPRHCVLVNLWRGAPIEARQSERKGAGQMKNHVRFLAVATAAVGCMFAGPVGLQFSPSSQAVLAGQSVSAGVVITGLGLPPEVGSFDLSIAFDSS